MKPILFFVSALTLMACGPSDAACKSLAVGQSAANLPKKTQLTTISTPSGSMYAFTQRNPPSDGDFVLSKDAAEEALCCVSKAEGKPLGWCTPTQLECTAPATVYLLGNPYSYTGEGDIPDAYYCSIATKNDSIVAVWLSAFRA